MVDLNSSLQGRYKSFTQGNSINLLAELPAEENFRPGVIICIFPDGYNGLHNNKPINLSQEISGFKRVSVFPYKNPPRTMEAAFALVLGALAASDGYKVPLLAIKANDKTGFDTYTKPGYEQQVLIKLRRVEKFLKGNSQENNLNIAQYFKLVQSNALNFQDIARDVMKNLTDVQHVASANLNVITHSIRQTGGKLERMSRPLAKALVETADKYKVPIAVVIAAVFLMAVLSPVGI